MHKKKVGVVCGGYSSEYEISLQSGKNVFSHLDRKLWEVFLIVINEKSWTAKDDSNCRYVISKGDFSLIASKTKIKLDIILNLVHGSIGENGKLAALWELLKIPFSSCDSYNAALTFNKRDCLSILSKSKISIAKNFYLDEGDSIDIIKIIKKVGLPCFVKANRSGSSFGVFKVNEEAGLYASIKNAFEEDSQLIIESALEGREFSVGAVLFDKKGTI